MLDLNISGRHKLEFFVVVDLDRCAYFQLWHKYYYKNIIFIPVPHLDQNSGRKEWSTMEQKQLTSDKLRF